MSSGRRLVEQTQVVEIPHRGFSVPLLAALHLALRLGHVDVYADARFLCVRRQTGDRVWVAGILPVDAEINLEPAVPHALQFL